ncbi:hypothetical protein CQ011_04025 [Arthrobacter sp. MYb213]|nr:hypothetical protein CQ011_04025 [Arthrobacter sp. MYb213]
MSEEEVVDLGPETGPGNTKRSGDLADSDRGQPWHQLPNTGVESLSDLPANIGRIFLRAAVLFMRIS